MTSAEEFLEQDIYAAVHFGRKALGKALSELPEEHEELFKIKANERAITHVLACSWERHFGSLVSALPKVKPTWSIDCEYNRMFDEPITKYLPYGLLLDRLNELWTQRAKSEIAGWRDHLAIFSKEDFAEVGNEITDAWEKRRVPQVGEKTVVPDIILHQRTINQPDNNAIVLEAKPNWGNKKAQLFDLVKLSTFATAKDADSPTYQCAFYVHFADDGKVKAERSWKFTLGGDEPESFDGTHE